MKQIYRKGDKVSSDDFVNVGVIVGPAPCSCIDCRDLVGIERKGMRHIYRPEKYILPRD